jgi:hypothetical protein
MNRPAPSPNLRRIKRQPRIHRPRALTPPNPPALAETEQPPPAEPANETVETPTPPAEPIAEQILRPALPEWHTMTSAERTIAWAELCLWVTWLNDRYELSLEQRLPRCWAEHPALIEELWSLKAWRHEIYTSTEPVGQAARYWHTELRTLLTAAGTVWASGCRAGHRSADHHAAEDTELQHRWKTADPLAGVPTPMRDTTTIDPKDVRSSTAMAKSMERGNAHYLHPAMRDFATHDNSWWVIDPTGHWVRIKDNPLLTASLDSALVTMRKADEAAERHRAKVAATLEPESTSHDTAGADHA